MLIKSTVVIAAVLLLTGCATNRELGERFERECAEFNFKPGTPAFEQCKLDAVRRHKQPVPGPVTCNHFGNTTVCN